MEQKSIHAVLNPIRNSRRSRRKSGPHETVAIGKTESPRMGETRLSLEDGAPRSDITRRASSVGGKRRGRRGCPSRQRQI